MVNFIIKIISVIFIVIGVFIKAQILLNNNICFQIYLEKDYMINNQPSHYNKDYFIILAHVEQRSGFFEELDGGRIQEFSKHKLFRKNILAFQKVTKYDLSVWNQWFDNELPAFVEGSDPKKIDEIGKGEKSYIKIGDYNFEDVKFALQDKECRVKKEKHIIQQYQKDIYQ